MQGASTLRPDHGAVQSFGWIGLQAKKCDVGLRTGDPEHHANCLSGIESVWMQISLQPSRNLMLKHMALSTLPANQMVPVFQQLKQEVLHLQPLRLRKQVQIMHRNYFLKWWFQGIGPQLISTYGLAHKTNNVCESLHKKMSLKLAKASTI
nr:uncharacterized protein LOC124814617 [Hydra vulgaris]